MSRIEYYRERRPLGHPRRPRLTIYRAANPRRFQAMWNRYPGCIIGAAVQIRGRVLSLTWASPANRKHRVGP